MASKASRIMPSSISDRIPCAWSSMISSAVRHCRAMSKNPSAASAMDWLSLPLGALPVEALLAAGTAEAKARIDAELQQHLPKAFAKPVFYAVGGGWRSLARVHMAQEKTPVPVVHGHTVKCDEIRD